MGSSNSSVAARADKASARNALAHFQQVVPGNMLGGAGGSPIKIRLRKLGSLADSSAPGTLLAASGQISKRMEG